MRTIILLSLLALVGCEYAPPRNIHGLIHGEDERASNYVPGGIYRTKQQACEYIVWYGHANNGGIVHAGDCPNPAHNCPCDTLKP